MRYLNLSRLSSWAPTLRSTSNAACIQVFAISNNIWRCLSDLVSAAPRKQSCANSRYSLGDAAMGAPSPNRRLKLFRAETANDDPAKDEARHEHCQRRQQDK